MEKSAGAFKYRGFVAMVMVLSGATLPVTGIANHFHAFGPLSLERHAWMSAHNAAGLLFAVFSIWHIMLNRRALWSHVRRTAAKVSLVSRETVFAGLVVVAVLTLFVGHAFHAGH